MMKLAALLIVIVGAAARAIQKEGPVCHDDQCLYAVNFDVCARVQTTTVFPPTETTTVTSTILLNGLHRRDAQRGGQPRTRTTSTSTLVEIIDSSTPVQTSSTTSVAVEASSTTDVVTSETATSVADATSSSTSSSTASRVADGVATVPITITLPIGRRDALPTQFATVSRKDIVVPAFEFDGCEGKSALQSACSCLGVAAATVTESTRTVTSTHTVCPTDIAIAGFSQCENSCANTLDDRANCGVCGNQCAPGLYCLDGKCSGRQFELHRRDDDEDGTDGDEPLVSEGQIEYTIGTLNEDDVPRDFRKRGDLEDLVPDESDEALVSEGPVSYSISSLDEEDIPREFRKRGDLEDSVPDESDEALVSEGPVSYSISALDEDAIPREFRRR
ncbi:hypothetical protein BS50DRAFT_387088 [Corynespora cassiicola Philippines]|uniref:4Fe-4S ferredoxin-type domain-containing protein n=1 Tax=Corynespora cassiicola Philippines TaxID=1448308 RepID=A0A2T2NP92_CORCC|nr:hypothetical protein BS50DRAFT_387088 [Corynespora cassiicola Philippines]